jgi:hypothetical protein
VITRSDQMGQLAQGVGGFRRVVRRQVSHCQLQFLVGSALRPLAGARSLDQVRGVCQLIRAELPPALVELGELPPMRRSGVQRGDDGQRLLTGLEIGVDRFAGDPGVTPDAQDVVDQLEGQADLAAEDLQRADGGGRRAGQ